MDDREARSEGVARVGIAVWVGEREGEGFEDPLPVLGVVGEQCLVEIDGANRERLLRELVDEYAGDDRSLGIEIALFGDAGGFFASSMSFLDHWPKSSADLPVEVFVDDRHRAAFTKVGDEVVLSVRHALRPSDRPKRRLRLHASAYELAMSELARESRRLHDDLIAVAQRWAPEKVASLTASLARMCSAAASFAS